MKLTEEITLTRALTWILMVFCTVLFLLLSKDEIMRYRGHPTATSTNVATESDIDFPAVTICVKHHKFAQLFEDLEFPRNPFAPPSKVKTDLDMRKLTDLNINITETIWKYFFSVTDIIDHCKIGPFDCLRASDEEYGQFYGDKAYWENGTLHRKIDTGKWISQIITDGYYGYTFMCHTFVPDFKLDFGQRSGNVMAFAWKEDFKEDVSHWEVYVHYKYEDVLMFYYGITFLPYIAFSESDTRRKVQIFPERRNNPNTEAHPCNSNITYSYNRCQLDWCWKQRFAHMREKYGSYFKCIIPGIAHNEGMPVCDHFTISFERNDSLGLNDLLHVATFYTFMKEQRNRTANELTLILPSLAFELPSDCLERCSTYKYQLVQEAISEKDDAVFGIDLYLYFPTAEVKLWRQYEDYGILTLISNIGGMMGLFLGASIMTLFTLLVYAISFFKKLGKGKKLSVCDLF